MKNSLAATVRIAAALCTLLLCFPVIAAQAEQRPIMTTHVPEAVSSGVSAAGRPSSRHATFESGDLFAPPK